MTDADPESDVESDLVDLTGVPLSRLRSLDDTVLSHAIRRVRDELANGPQLLAAFENGIAAP